MREGIIPTVLGTAVTAAGSAVKARDIRRNGMGNKSMTSTIAAGVIGFGLAHVVLGAIDIAQHRR